MKKKKKKKKNKKGLKMNLSFIFTFKNLKKLEKFWFYHSFIICINGFLLYTAAQTMSGKLTIIFSLTFFLNLFLWFYLSKFIDYFERKCFN